MSFAFLYLRLWTKVDSSNNSKKKELEQVSQHHQGGKIGTNDISTIKLDEAASYCADAGPVGKDTSDTSDACTLSDGSGSWSNCAEVDPDAAFSTYIRKSITR